MVAGGEGGEACAGLNATDQLCLPTQPTAGRPGVTQANLPHHHTNDTPAAAPGGAEGGSRGGGRGTTATAGEWGEDEDPNAAETGGGASVQLFRSVDAAEFDSIAATGRFSTTPGQMEGKFFATTGEHAEQWGQLLHHGDAITVETRIPQSAADQLFLREGKLDGVGPVMYAEGGQLDMINGFMDGIRAWP